MNATTKHRLQGGGFVILFLVASKLVRKASRALSESLREAMAELTNDTPGLEHCAHCHGPIVSGFALREDRYHRACFKDAVSTGALPRDDAEKAELFTGRNHPLNQILSEALTAGVRDAALSAKAEVKDVARLHIIPDKP